MRKKTTPVTLNWIGVIRLVKRLIDKFYEGVYEKENVLVPENNDSSDKKSDREVSDFLSCEDCCDECFIQK